MDTVLKCAIVIGGHTAQFFNLGFNMETLSISSTGEVLTKLTMISIVIFIFQNLWLKIECVCVNMCWELIRVMKLSVIRKKEFYYK